MQKTYSELFKLQNLLEKTVRSVEVSNNLKSVGSAELSSSKQATANGDSSGRPYYPGSPVKGDFYCAALFVPSNPITNSAHDGLRDACGRYSTETGCQHEHKRPTRHPVIRNFA
jgi:hypothetical protein